MNIVNILKHFINVVCILWIFAWKNIESDVLLWAKDLSFFNNNKTHCSLNTRSTEIKSVTLEL